MIPLIAQTAWPFCHTGAGWGWHLLWWGIVAALFVGLAVALVRREPERRTSARMLLDERYARGELSTDEYHERLEVLR
jgi:putative membrane protein